MKTATDQNLQQNKHRGLRATGLGSALGLALMTGLTPPVVTAAPVNGTTNGQTVISVVGDDTITVKTINIDYFTSCYFITQGVSNGMFGAYNFVFAGQGAASGIPNIDPSDFTVSQYAPWVGNNNSAMNGVIAPNTTNYNRGLTNQEAGGANILISYKPQNASDPTNINFLQAYIININNTGFASGQIDNGGMGGPFYNENGVSGTGTTNRAGTIPFMTSSTVPGWLLDIPYTPEFGYSKPGADDTITNEVVTFQTFISSEQNINGTNYNVLYGGIQWGYSFDSIDVIPEPTSLALFASGGFVSAVLARGLRRPKRSRR